MSTQIAHSYSDAEIVEHLVNLTRAFDARNWLAPVSVPITPRIQEAINKEQWEIKQIRDFVIEHGCVGCCLCALFGLRFSITYDQIADVFKTRYGEGFWRDGFALEAGGPERAAWEEEVRAGLYPVVRALRAKAEVPLPVD